MLLEIVACVSIAVIALLAKLSWWRQQCNRLIVNDKPNFFNPLGGILEYDAFEFSGKKKQAVHLGLMAAFGKWSNKFRAYPLVCKWMTYVPFVLIHKSDAVKDLLLVKKMSKRDGFMTSLHKFVEKVFLLVIVSSGKIEGSCSPLASRATCSKATSPFSTSTRRNSSKCIMGVKIGALENGSKQYVESLHRNLDLMMARVLKFWQWPNLLYWNSKTGKEAAYHRKVMHDFSRAVIEDRKRRYLNALDEEGVKREVDTFIIAGHDTVAATIKYALYLIGHHPEVQEKIFQEIDSVFEGDADRPLSVDDLSDLKYLDCVLKECNRIYPQWLYRTQRSFRYCDDVLPAQRPRIFPDPEKFDPDRFLPENKNKIPECAFCAFWSWAETLYRTVVRRDGGEDHGVPHFEKLLHSLSGLEDKMLMVMNITLKSSQPVRIRFRPRHNNNSQ
ncbi:cytochrome P450 4V2 [Caerostris extrusa]|uniref:Cytochrome P450 4V2 n=1 Tax=Caerostris extrusa TaxID=172846 RepID=A0AAV4QGS1_CAEEX|nr:cytochrome P450 4V2 [Caerostris extrusa]